MEDLLSQVIPWLEQWGYAAVFLGIMLENAGIPVPGETMIIAAAVLAGRGVLDIGWVYVASVVGAILGDNIGYWIGAKGGRRLILRFGRPFGVTPEKLSEAERIFQDRCDWAVFFGRFVTLLRIFAGPLAGLMGMRYGRFLFFNSTGAMLWVAIVAGASYLFSNELELIIGFLHRLGWFSLLGLVLILGFLLFRAVKRRQVAAHSTQKE